jgi:hypothetical protein
MTSGQPFHPTSATGLEEARARDGGIPQDAVDGGLIALADSLDQSLTSAVGTWWLVLASDDQRTGLLYSRLDEMPEAAHLYAGRATVVERYVANLLVAARKLDIVYLLRQKDVIDYREQGRAHDDKLARTLAAIRARKGQL